MLKKIVWIWLVYMAISIVIDSPINPFWIILNNNRVVRILTHSLITMVFIYFVMRKSK
jgi:hypothetical protein